MMMMSHKQSSTDERARHLVSTEAMLGALSSAPRIRRREGERGYTLVALLAMMTILALILSTAAPSMRQQSQRELEKESIARGEEVAEAIALYVNYKAKETGLGTVQLPTSMDDLLKGVAPFPGAIKKISILRPEAARDPLSSSGEWKLVAAKDRAFIDFQQAVMKYNNGQIPITHDSLLQNGGFVSQITGLNNLKTEEDAAPGGEDTTANTSGPFIGVVSRSRRKSVLTYYGIERHDRWVFTPIFR